MLQRQASKQNLSRQPGIARDRQHVTAPVSGHARSPEHDRSIGNQAAARLLQRRAAATGAFSGTFPQTATAKLVLQRKCACGGSLAGECEECIKTKIAGLQTKLRISEPGDIYEQQADRVADKVMAKSARSGVSSAPVRIQRRVNVGPVRDPLEYEADRIAELVTGERAPAPTAATMRLAAAEAETAHEKREPHLDESENALTSGGAPMPQAVRSFYEERFGYDFSGVRIHVGDEASRRSQAMNAHAFTFAHHVWLGADQRVGRSFVLAHELAHVIQQTHRAAAPAVRRAIDDPYWVPMEAARDTDPGTFTHNLVLRGGRGIASASHVLAEAPVPNASKPKVGTPVRVDFGLVGFVDLYSGKDANGTSPRTVGVLFNNSGEPAVLPSVPGGPHARRDAAPVVSANWKPGSSRGKSSDSPVDKVDLAPVEIKVAELKPAWGTLEAAEGPKQLEGYIRGYDFARKEVNELSNAGKVLPRGATWQKRQPETTAFRVFDRSEITIPPAFDSGTGQRSRSLVLIKDDGIHRRETFIPRDQVLGRVYVGSLKNGILSYVWIPDHVPPGRELSGTLVRLHGHIQSEIVAPVISSPLSQSPVRKAPKAITDQPPSLTTDRTHRLRRRMADVTEAPQDKFVTRYKTTWLPAVNKYTNEFNQYRKARKTHEFESDKFRTIALKAQQNTRDAGFSAHAPLLTKEQLSESKTLDETEFWTGSSVEVIGFFRATFGSAFVFLHNLYVRVRERLKNLLQSRAEGSGGGIEGAAFRVVFKLLKMAGKIIISEVLNELASSLVTGVTNKLRELLPVERIEELREKVAEVKKLADDINKSALGKLNSFLRDVLGPFGKVMKAVEAARDTFEKIKTVISIVRWGARVIACASPPALGCLWILAQSVLEKFASIVIESCWFQQKVAPYVFEIPFVRRELPRRVAETIRSLVVGIFPGLTDVFAEIAPEVEFDEKKDVACGKGPSGAELTPERQAILDLMERLRVEACGGDADCAEQLLLAYARLTQRAGITEARKLTPEEIGKLGDQIIASGLTPEQLNEFADSYDSPRNGKEVDLKEFLEKMKATPAGTGNLPPSGQPETRGGKVPEPSVAPAGGRAAGPPEKGKGTGKDQRPAEPPPRTWVSTPEVDASAITHDVTGPKTSYELITLAENASASDQLHKPASITVAVRRKSGELIVRIKNVPVIVARVDRRSVKGRTVRRDIIYVTVTAKPLDLSQWLPGGIIEPGRQVPGFVILK
jgi:hypothetical protein